LIASSENPSLAPSGSTANSGAISGPQTWTSSDPLGVDGEEGDGRPGVVTVIQINPQLLNVTMSDGSSFSVPSAGPGWAVYPNYGDSALNSTSPVTGRARIPN
jgi:hypothetical protein